ncbi:ferredoxin domain-containing protein [Sinanaerobacter chloroacetimidivorans]|jgi:uncharacterized ferredoxin-like protein|uniref:Ferredoxin n=1 Tax=Sinanaerobacter chloroacetimidivorans TaxID=2818044 RepID=A0A8J8B3K1_9FIRM|nr:DUF2148 domain-containing protein [Sinanaerobacter chloroacetimidivorans]MBR0598405.1 ferredoxin [Sinanaerobacter chloroacetimidivorans]
MIYNNEDAEKRAIMQVADLMLAAARTAPKGCGIDNLVTMIVDGEEKDKLADAMRKIAKDTSTDFFARDAGNVDASPAVVLVGTYNRPLGLDNCSLCGFANCVETKKAGANCAFNVNDLGIALGSAVSTAAAHKIDNRIMFSVGKAALKLNYLPEDVSVVFGIPLSTTSKSIFFDRDSKSVLSE